MEHTLTPGLTTSPSPYFSLSVPLLPPHASFFSLSSLFLFLFLLLPFCPGWGKILTLMSLHYYRANYIIPSSETYMLMTYSYHSTSHQIPGMLYCLVPISPPRSLFSLLIPKRDKNLNFVYCIFYVLFLKIADFEGYPVPEHP